MKKETQRLLERVFGEKIDPSDFDQEGIIAYLESALSTLEPNLILMTDGYKYSHPKFYTPGLTKMTSYLESRGGKFQETVFFGLQYIIKKYLTGSVLSKLMVIEAHEKLNGEKGVFGPNGSFSKDQWLRLVEKHDGRLPIKIKAVPEGTVVPVKNVLMTIESTDEEFPWLVGFLETLILEVWYPITVATLSREVKKIVIQYLRETGAGDNFRDPEPHIHSTAEFILNDFGMRGVSSMESAAIGGAAHLVNFMGSDNVVGSDLVVKYYNTDIMYGKSIDATEHSICTMEGEEGELEVFKRVLQLKPDGLVACVSDSFNIFRACSEYWGTELKDIILSRNGTLVIRPDSGDPVATLKEIFKILFDKFGYTASSYGMHSYKVLPSKIRVIQGDGVNYESIKAMYQALKDEGIAAENLVLGMGGKLLQAGLDRDTQNFAIKACHAIINGKEVDIVKSPTEMDADGNIHQSFKKSKKGLMKLARRLNGEYFTILSSEEGYEEATDQLVTVFENGELLVDYTFEEIREKAKIK